jgi:FkbM family methyltransferase
VSISERTRRIIDPGLANVSAVSWLTRFYFRHTTNYKIATYRNRVIQRSYGGYPLTISLEDPVADGWYDHDWPLMPELLRLKHSRLRPGARVFDVGAHQGIVALILARLVGPTGQVVAVEAERHNADVATRNRDLNQASNLEIVHAAGGTTDGSLYFRNGLNGAVASKGHVGLARVPAVSIDGLAERYGAPNVVFIDVEGYEHEVLRGATRTLAAGNTDFFVEVHVGYGLESRGGSAASVIEHFDADRYQLLASPPGGEREEYEFAALVERPELLGSRFYLLALAAD